MDARCICPAPFRRVSPSIPGSRWISKYDHEKALINDDPVHFIGGPKDQSGIKDKCGLFISAVPNGIYFAQNRVPGKEVGNTHIIEVLLEPSRATDVFQVAITVRQSVKVDHRYR